MTEKEEIILNIISSYIKENNTMPTRRYIQKKLNYKSVNSITQYLKSLVKKGYLKYNNNHKLIIGNNLYNNDLKTIKIINLKNKEIEITLNKKKNYLGYKLNNDYFIEYHLTKGDILIIEEKKQLQNNDIGLFIIDDKYRVMKYHYKGGFYVLNDYETLYLSHVKIVGKVIKIIRTI